MFYFSYGPDSLTRSLSAAIKSLICALLSSVDLKVVRRPIRAYLDLQREWEWDLCADDDRDRPSSSKRNVDDDGSNSFWAIAFSHTKRNDEMKERRANARTRTNDARENGGERAGGRNCDGRPATTLVWTPIES